MGVNPTVVSIKKHEAVLKELQHESLRVVALIREIEDYRSRLAEMQLPAKIRPELSWFADECEKSLAYHDPVKGDSYKRMANDHKYFTGTIMGKLQDIIFEMAGPKRNRAIIRMAVGIANLSMMMAYLAAVEDGVFPDEIPF